MAVYLVLSFGFNGAPGEWMAWAAATLQYLQSHRPARGARDGPFRFQGEILMDGAVLIEPLLGLRPWAAADVYEKGTKGLLGGGAINAAKNELEGAFATRQTCWGLEIDTAARAVRIPERRILKGMYLLAPGHL